MSIEERVEILEKKVAELEAKIEEQPQETAKQIIDAMNGNHAPEVSQS